MTRIAKELVGGPSRLKAVLDAHARDHSRETRAKENSTKPAGRISSHAVWNVDKIIAARATANGKAEYLVLWTGYADPTWEPYSKSLDGLDAMVEFVASRDREISRIVGERATKGGAQQFKVVLKIGAGELFHKQFHQWVGHEVVAGSEVLQAWHDGMDSESEEVAR